jgi:hypothetical protein
MSDVIASIKVSKVLASPIASRSATNIRREAGAVGEVRSTIQVLEPLAAATTLSGGGSFSGTIDAVDVLYTNPAYPDIDNAQEAFDLLLYTALTASMSCSPSVVEVGATVDEATLSWSYNKTVLSQSINQGVGVLSPEVRSKALTALGLVSGRTWTLTGNDGTNNASASAGVAFQHKRRWGVSSTASASQALIEALTSEFSTSRVQTRTMNPTAQYLWFAWPESFGEPTFKIGGFVNTARIKTVVSFTNAQGYVSNFWCYRSQYIQNGSGIVVEVS